MPYRRFLPFNAAGALVWGTTVVLVGYYAGESFAVVERYVGRVAAIVIAVPGGRRPRRVADPAPAARVRRRLGLTASSAQLLILRTWAGVLVGLALLPKAQASMLP